MILLFNVFTYLKNPKKTSIINYFQVFCPRYEVDCLRFDLQDFYYFRSKCVKYNSAKSLCIWKRVCNLILVLI